MNIYEHLLSLKLQGKQSCSVPWLWSGRGQEQPCPRAPQQYVYLAQLGLWRWLMDQENLLSFIFLSGNSVLKISSFPDSMLWIRLDFCRQHCCTEAGLPWIGLGSLWAQAGVLGGTTSPIAVASGDQASRCHLTCDSRAGACLSCAPVQLKDKPGMGTGPCESRAFKRNGIVQDFRFFPVAPVLPECASAPSNLTERKPTRCGSVMRPWAVWQRGVCSCAADHAGAYCPRLLI